MRLYRRVVFFNGLYRKELLGVRLKALVPKDNDSQLFTAWLEQGAFDAIEKGYVRKLLFGVYKDPHGKDIIEQYSFYLEYPSQTSVSLSVQGKQRDGTNTEKQPLLYQNCTKENINYEGKFILSLSHRLSSQSHSWFAPSHRKLEGTSQ